MKLEDAIKLRRLIDIDTAPNTDNVYTGICLVANSEIIMLLSLDEENGEFDGFTIVQNKDVEKYRIWEEEDYSELKNDNSESLIASVDLNNFTDLETSLKSLTSDLVAIFTYEDENTFFVGEVLSVNKNSVELHLVSGDAKWLENIVIMLSDISYLGFDTSYEREIKKKLAQK
ncbi:hypothetical protein [Fluviicola sp.]|uniref:hypothetical protein n=1 Tax=Fluviicola sp. TaxID=1917219 RepID=UPI003D2B3A5D